jgi:succinoglycan biosynthesis transport protein ExoP
MSDSQDSLHFLDYWRVISSRKEIVIAVSLLVVVAGVVATYAMPKVYMASAVIKVQEESNDVDVFSQQMMRYDPLFLRTQFEIIQSRPILEGVIKRTGLDRDLAEARGTTHRLPAEQLEDAYDMLSKSMKVQQYRDTNLIEIQIYFAEPKDKARVKAAEVANRIEEVFRLERSSKSRRTRDGAMKVLRASWEEQETRVIEAEAEVARIRREKKINTLGGGSSANSRASLAQLTLMHLEEMRLVASQEVAEQKSRSDLVQSLPPDELLAAAPYLMRDVITAELVASKRRAEIGLSRLLGTYGSKHPDVMTARTEIAEISAKIDDALAGLRTGVRANLEAAQAKYATLETELADRTAIQRERQTEDYTDFDKANERLARARKIRDALEMRYLQEQIENRIPKTTVELIEPARVPDEDDFVSPNFSLNVLLSIFVGLCAGVGLAYFVEYLDTSVKTIEDIESALGLPVLGVIPQKVRPMSEAGANPNHAEFYRVLRTNLMFSDKFGEGSKAVCFTSGSMGEGKSLTLFNLAHTTASLGDRVIVVDSDLHRPRQHKMFDVPNKRGLANVLIGEATLDEVINKDVFPNLDFLSSGSLDSGVHGLLDTQRVRALVKELKESYDMVFFDAPPIIGVSDAAVLAREVDGVMLLIQHRKYPKALSIRAKGMLTNMGANVLGVVLNNINISKDQSYYYYHQNYYQADYTTKQRSRKG